MTMVFLLGFSVMGAAYFTLTATFSGLANRGFNKTEATSLAEAGVHRMYAQVSSSLLSGSLNTAAIGSTTLTGAINGSSTNDGSYTATVLSSSGPTTNTVSYGGNGGTETTSIYTFTVQGTGTARNGVTSVVQSTFTDEQVQTTSLVAGSGTDYTFPEGAVNSNSNISLVGNSATHAQVIVHGAGVNANGVVSGVGNYSVDGSIDVAPGSAYSGTVSALGSSPHDYGSTVTALSAPISFPSASTISQWQSTYTSESQEATTTYPSGHTVTSPTGTLTAPAYVNGNISLSGNNSLTINPDPTATKPVVVYVNGSISEAGNASLTNNGVILVASGTISLAGNGGYSTSSTSNSQDGLISFSSASNAVSLKGNGQGVGLVYAVNGGVTLNGNGSLTGSLIAGGTGSSGGVSFTGNATVYYPGDLNTNFTGLPPADQWQTSTPQKYTASSLESWLQTR